MSTKKDLDQLLQHFVRDRKNPGAALTVCRGGEVLYEGYFGYRDLAQTQPLTPDTIFRIHSITKAYTALCGMMEFEKGVFLMDDPVSRFLPEYAHLKISVQQPDGSWTVEDSKTPMLMKHLFNMNVGFYAHDGSPTDKMFPIVHDRIGGVKFGASYDLRTEIRAMADVPMAFEPGTHFQYGYGIIILAAVVEVISGMSIADYMQKYIFDPLGMTESGFRFREGWKARLAECIRRRPDGSVYHCDDLLGDPLDAMYEPDTVYYAPDAGVLSTLRDLQTFSCMLANRGSWKGERIIGRKTIDFMRQNLLTDDMMEEFQIGVPFMKGYGYGCGVRTMLDPAASLGNGSVGEFGWLGVGGAWMMADPSEKLSAAFLLQEMDGDIPYYHDRLRNVIYGLL